MYCSNSNDEEHILKIGNNIVKEFKEHICAKDGNIYYKADDQTRKIQKGNSMYKIKINK